MRDRQRAQQRLLQVVGLQQAASEQENAVVREPAGDKDGRFTVAARIRQGLLLDDMGPPVDRNCGHAPHVAEQHGPLPIEHGDIVQAADVPRQAQLQRPAEVSLAVVLAFRRFIDEDGASALEIRAVDLPVNEGKGRSHRDRNGENERQRQAKRPRVEDLKPSAFSLKPTARMLTMKRRAPVGSSLRRKLPI